MSTKCLYAFVVKVHPNIFISAGITDIALVYPLAVLATRREAGTPLVAALKQGRFWAGGWTAGSLLIPYSIVVEGGSNSIRRNVCSAMGIDERSWQGDVASAFGTASIVTYLGLQPIEKKLVMDQLLEEQGNAAAAAAAKRRNPLLAPVKEIYQYANTHGIRALYGGALPLLMRELCYISAITIANPMVITHTRTHAHTHTHTHTHTHLPHTIISYLYSCSLVNSSL
jgi:hypothetical protein